MGSTRKWISSVGTHSDAVAVGGVRVSASAPPRPFPPETFRHYFPHIRSGLRARHVTRGAVLVLVLVLVLVIDKRFLGTWTLTQGGLDTRCLTNRALVF